MAAHGLKTVGVVLLGCGKVGSAVARRLAAAQQFHAERYHLRFSITAITDSSGAVANADGIADLEAALQAKANRQAFASLADGVAGGPELDSCLRSKEKHIFVDCTATDAVGDLLCEVLSNNNAVVFANKKVLTGPMRVFRQLTSPDHAGRCRFESSVGAGTPFVAAVQRVVAAHDRIHSIQGTFSGTLGFITSGLDKGLSFSTLVREAYDKGYTEPDPRDDLSGMDVARKALILSRISGWDREMSHVEVESLYPQDLAHVSVEEFLARIGEFDASIAQRQAAAASQGCVLRYLASVSPSGCKVGLRAVPQTSPIGRLQGTANILNVTSDIYEAPLVIQGSGAGVEITAAGIVADMVEICSHGL